MLDSKVTTVKKVAGELFHRAVTMPYVKPQVLKVSKGSVRLGNGQGESIVAAAGVAERLLEEALVMGLEGKGWVLARSLIDAGGYWWSGLVDDFQKLTSEDQGWVVKSLRGPAVEAVAVMEERMLACAGGGRVAWMWAEAPLVDVETGEKVDSTRPDLMIGTKAGNIALVDLKSSWLSTPTWARGPGLSREEKRVRKKTGGEPKTGAQEVWDDFRRREARVRRLDGVPKDAQVTYWVLEVGGLNPSSMLMVDAVRLGPNWRNKHRILQSKGSSSGR